MPTAPRRLATIAGLALAATGLAVDVPSVLVPAAHANPVGSGLVINEVYGAGGNAGAAFNADFVELYNPTSAPIDLAGHALHYRSAAGGSGGTPFALSGSVPARSHYLVQMSAPGADGVALPKPDATASPAFAMAASGGQVALQEGISVIATTGDTRGVAGIVDFFGTSGAASFETAAAGSAASASQSLNRSAGADTDSNAADFSLAAPNPMVKSGGEATPLTATDPGDRTVQAEVATSLTLAADGGTAPYSWTATGLPGGLSLASATGVVSGTPTTPGEYAVTATVTDSTGASATTDFVVTVTAAPALRSVAEIQGTGAASPLDGQTVTTQGVVTAMYRDPAFANSSIDGMYVQTGGTGIGTDATPGASDAIFVYGAHSMPAGVAIGDSVRVTGVVSEFFGTTEITPAAGGVTELATPLAAVTPLAAAYPTTEAGREAHEGELLAPTDSFTVTNVYHTNTFAEVGLATGGRPLVQPTEVCRDDATDCLAQVKADNAARGGVLDDGTSVNYMTNSAARDQPLPWLSPTHPIRVGASASLTGPVILEFRNGAWKLQPTSPVFDQGASVATFANTRAADAAPAEIGGDLQIGTFNVLNYFNTTGEAFELAGGDCTFYTDRDGVPIATNRCNPDGPRGAATQVSFERQQAKIVRAINGLGADVVALEELENSIKLLGETDRDDAIAALVTALNAAAGAGTWDYVRSPAEAVTAAAVAEQDVIRAGFIYKPAEVVPVGESDLLLGTTEFSNAREPLAQAFRPVGAPESATFGVIANHFKSKGDSDPAAGGDNANNPDTGAFNGDRVRQAQRLAAFAQEFATARSVAAMFLVGDFNAYTEEDPIHVLRDAGYHPVESDDPTDESYSFGGLSGSLDHVLANAAASAMVTGADIWEINANESIAFQYSRYNYNVTQFFDGSTPFAASDHNPEVVGLRTAVPPGTTTLVPQPVASAYGRGLRLRARVVGDAPTGQVTFASGGTTLGTAPVGGGGWAVLLLAEGALGPGDHTLTATYAGDAANPGATAAFVVTVAKAAARQR